MTDLLVILNPRRITECLLAFAELPIDRLWLRNMAEATLEQRWPEVMDAARDYERLILVSDDVIATPCALAAVSRLMDEHPVVTGYCNLDVNDERVNITRSPLGDQSVPQAYDFYTREEAADYPYPAVPTTFAGFAFTGMSRDLWTTYPYELEYTGHSADYTLSQRLSVAGIPIVAARDAFIWHVKEEWGLLDKEPRKQLFVGIEPEAIELERA